MDKSPVEIEKKTASFLRQYEDEWLTVCGLQTDTRESMLKILRHLRSAGLLELEAMMIWRMEHMELN